MRKWREVVADLAALGPVLIHGDIAEDQILIGSEDDLEISGILDWSTAAIANLIFDFNFWEWGFAIWRFQGSFRRLRRAMWETYLEARGISSAAPEGLHLLYSLLALYWVATFHEPLVSEGSPLERESYSILEDLRAVTDSL